MGGIALLPVFLRIKTCLLLVSCSLLSIMTAAAVRTTTGGFPLGPNNKGHSIWGLYGGPSISANYVLSDTEACYVLHLHSYPVAVVVRATLMMITYRDEFFCYFYFVAVAAAVLTTVVELASPSVFQTATVLISRFAAMTAIIQL